MKDLEAVETRLGRDPSESEKAVLQKLADALMSEKPVSAVGLTADELKAISAHNFYSNKPVIVAAEAELTAPDALMVRAFKESGYVSFLTVGGEENRAWSILARTTARELPRAIHSDIPKGCKRAQIIRFAGLVQA